MDFRKSKRGTDKIKNNGGSLALTAVALQDHWSRQLSLGVRHQPRNIGLGPAARARLNNVKNVKPVVDTGRGRRAPLLGKVSDPRDEDIVLDAIPPPLTLAQKLGLVDAPEKLLSEADWKTVKDKSNKRDDSRQPCVICKEDFGLQEQVLLSCSHVFHRACLQAFERFTGRKTCPMCRREQYQTRLIHEGAREHRVACVTRIQAAWRGYVVRCWYHKLRETHPPTDWKLRKKFFEEKLQLITDRIVKSCDFNIADFLSEIDQNLEASKQVFRNFDALVNQISEDQWDSIQLKAVERGHKECPICLTSLTSSGLTNNPEPTPRNKKRTRKAKPNPLEKLNKYSLSKTLDPLSKGTDNVDEPGEDIEGDGSCRTTVLLSCSHVYHATCLDMLEQLALGEIKRVCPVCRTSYQKKVIQLSSR